MSGWFFSFVVVTLAFASNAGAYWVGPAVSLEDIAKESDLIFKGRCISGNEVKDEWFKPVSGFQPFETQFKVTGVIKGKNIGETLRFRHYDVKLEPMTLIGYVPQSYHFEQGSTYLIFAKRSDVPGTFRQLWAEHTGKHDQGVLLCADAEPVEVDGIKQVVWTEMHKMLQSKRAEHVLYGISQLDSMSNSKVNDESDHFDAFNTTRDFDRLEVLRAIIPLAKIEHDEIAQQAIAVVGSRNPYMTEDGIHHWLATVADRDPFGNGTMNRNMKNPGGALYQAELVSIAEDRKSSGKTRASAVTALGLVRSATILDRLEDWLKDSEPLVRSAAALLLSDVPLKQGTRLLRPAVADQAAEVRTSAAYAIGIGRHSEYVATLGDMLKDPDAKVRRAASMSLLSFSPKKPAVAEILKSNIDNKEFKPLFLNALATDSIEPYLESIAKVVEEKPVPTNWSGGNVPAFVAWKLLFKHLQAQSAKELQSGKWDRFLGALENGYLTGSSEPTKIYAFYLQRGLVERARNYREAARKKAGYDIDLYFNRVDANPQGESL